MQPLMSKQIKPRGCTARHAGRGGEQGMLMYNGGRMQPTCACRGVCVCLTSPHPIPDHRIGSAHCHHEGAARVALHVHKAVLVYAEEEQHKKVLKLACFRVGT